MLDHIFFYRNRLFQSEMIVLSMHKKYLDLFARLS